MFQKITSVWKQREKWELLWKVYLHSKHLRLHKDMYATSPFFFFFCSISQLLKCIKAQNITIKHSHSDFLQHSVSPDSNHLLSHEKSYQQHTTCLWKEEVAVHSPVRASPGDKKHNNFVDHVACYSNQVHYTNKALLIKEQRERKKEQHSWDRSFSPSIT